MHNIKKKNIILLSLLSLIILIWSCSKDETSYINYKLVEINYEDFNYCILKNNKTEFRIYDTINDNRNLRLKDTTRLYFPTLFTTFESNNNITFNFLNDNMIKFVDKSKNFQIIAKELKKDDSIFILKDNSIDNPIFIVNDKNNEYTRTLSAYRVIYEIDGLRRDSVELLDGKLIDLDYLKNYFDLNKCDNSTQSDTLIWVNLVYKYSN